MVSDVALSASFELGNRVWEGEGRAKHGHGCKEGVELHGWYEGGGLVWISVGAVDFRYREPREVDNEGDVWGEDLVVFIHF